MTEKPTYSAEARAASKMLLTGASIATSGMSLLSAWLTVGLSAAFSLIIANLDVVATFVELGRIRTALLIFLVGLLVAGIAQLLGIMVRAGVDANTEGEKVGREMKPMSDSFDIEEFVAEYKKGLFWPYRSIAQWSIGRAQAGDLAAQARFLAKLSQAQAILVLAQMVLSGLSVITFVLAISKG